ncbi:MAG: hypothetical protein WDM89_14410, partial [Rhizomicrobium sp.]
MAEQNRSIAFEALIPMITERLKRAHDTAAAAASIAAAGNRESAFRILLDIEEPTFQASTLLNAISVIHRDGQD